MSLSKYFNDHVNNVGFSSTADPVIKNMAILYHHQVYLVVYNAIEIILAWQFLEMYKETIYNTKSTSRIFDGSHCFAFKTLKIKDINMVELFGLKYFLIFD